MLRQIALHLLPKNVAPTTYGLGILQAKSYRVLKAATSDHLLKTGITSVDWALLGTLFDAKEGMSLSELSEWLEVKAPLVTLRVNKLVDLGYLSRGVSNKDSRSRIVKMTVKGKKFVPMTERSLRDAVKLLFKGTSVRDLTGFVRVTSKVALNGRGLQHEKVSADGE